MVLSSGTDLRPLSVEPILTTLVTLAQLSEQFCKTCTLCRLHEILKTRRFIVVVLALARLF